MKQITSILVILFLACHSCTSSPSKRSSTGSLTTSETPAYQIPDTIFAPGGFRIGMTEDEIRQMVKDNPGKYYTNQDQILRLLHTRIDGRDYSMFLGIYKGKLNNISYEQSSICKQIDNPDLKTHYQNIYDLIAGLNEYRVVEQTYKKKTDFDWPLSMGTHSFITMAEFIFGDMYSLHERFTISLTVYEGLYSIDFEYYGTEEQESTLSKVIYFD